MSFDIIISTLFALGCFLFLFAKYKKLVKKFETQEKINERVLRSRDYLLRSVNHELRAPLTRMKLDLEFLPESEEKKSLSQDVLLMEDLIHELMEIEKVKALSYEKVDVNLNSLVHQVVSQLKVNEEELTSILDKEVIIRGHERQLNKLLKNLIENAFKYKPESGKVTIKSSLDNKRGHIIILNEGNVIPAEDIPYIFDPFYRTDKSRSSKEEGLGLGLSLCKEIVQGHGGTIQVNSKKGMGTIFKLSFPLIAT